MNKTKRTEQKSIRVTLSEQEWEKLDLICEDTGLDKSNAIRQLIKKYKVKKMTDREVIEQFYRQISWKDKCEEIEYGDRTLLKTDLVIRVPTYK